jgi:hypothetical protein
MSHLKKNPSNNLKPNTAGNASNTKNPTIYNINNTLICWAKRLVDQASEVPRIFFFTISYRLRALKTLYFYFCKFIKKKHRNKLKQFLQRILNYEKNPGSPLGPKDQIQ